MENRIQNDTDYANKYDVQIKTQLSQKEDADITAAAMNLTQGNTQLQAAFQMEGTMPRSTLFDYIG